MILGLRLTRIIMNPIWPILVYLGLVITTFHLEVEELKVIHLELLIFIACWVWAAIDLAFVHKASLLKESGIKTAGLIAMLLIASPLLTSLFSLDYLAILQDPEYKSYVKILLLSPLIFYYFSDKRNVPWALDVVLGFFVVLAIYFLFRYYYLAELREFDGRPLLKIRHGDPNFLSSFFAMTIPLAMWRSLSLLSANKKKSGFFFSALSLFLFAIVVITKSRMGIMVASAAVIYLVGQRNDANLKSYLSRVLVIVMGVTIGIFGLTQVESFRRVTVLQDKSSLDRLYTYENAIKIFAEYPILGVGMHKAKQFFFINSQYPHFQSEFSPLEVHNTFLNYLAELGIFGFAAIIALYFWAFQRIKSAPLKRRPFLLASFAILFVSGMTIGLSYKDLALVQLFLLAGLSQNGGEINGLC